PEVRRAGPQLQQQVRNRTLKRNAPHVAVHADEGLARKLLRWLIYTAVVGFLVLTRTHRWWPVVVHGGAPARPLGAL
ncbi:unnamed protein product, partial [Ectocarpus sp. 4 AP-2014]